MNKPLKKTLRSCRKPNFGKYLEQKDNKVGDFDEIPKVTLTKDCEEDDYELDMRCTDYGDAMDFF